MSIIVSMDFVRAFNGLQNCTWHPVTKHKFEDYTQLITGKRGLFSTCRQNEVNGPSPNNNNSNKTPENDK